MKLRGYKLSFELHAAHTNLQYAPDDYHFHTFSIVLWIKKKDRDLEIFDDMEKQVNTFLSAFEDQYLGDHPLFQQSDMTVESMGDIFFRELSSLINDERFELLRLDIWDNPVRQYSVTKYRMDMNINALNISMLLGTSDVNAHPIKPDTINHTIPQEPEPQAEAIRTQLATPIPKDQAPIGKKKRFRLQVRWQIVLALAVILAAACGIYSLIQGSMLSLYGSDTLYHLYHSDLLLEELQNGNLFPLYDASWYNGVEIMRYWGPVPLYVLAFIQFITQGSALNAYMWLIAGSVVVSAIGWLRFGIRQRRVTLAVVIGCLWFLLPENTRLFVLDGNIPRVLINVVVPFLFYEVWYFLQAPTRGSFVRILIWMSICVCSHIGMAGMVLCSLMVLILLYGRKKHQWSMLLQALSALLLPFLLCGVWSVPALIGGGASKGSATNQVMALFFAPLLESLNPLPHMEGDLGSFYIGLSVFFLCLCGVALGRKKERPVFLAVFLLLLCTSMTAYELFVVLPFSQFLWMIRMVPFALGLAMMGFLIWDHLRFWVKVVFCIALMFDAAPSLQYLMRFQEQRPQDTRAYAEQLAEAEGLIAGKAWTVQRLSVMDLSGYGAFAPYYVAGVEPKTSYLFGAGWEGSGIASQIVALNSAMTYGHYRYLFDRHLELGTDTIVIPTAYLANGAQDKEALKDAGALVGYECKMETAQYLVFHYPVETMLETAQFGTKTAYPYLAIGSHASDIAMMFPAFEEGSDDRIEAYDASKLKQYEKIYLSGFTYSNRQAAEALLREVSEAGVDIYIDMNAVPVEPTTRKQELFGVDAQSYRFQERFPTLYYKEEAYRTSLFSKEHTEWNAVSLSSLDVIDGAGEADGRQLVFSGTKENEHLHFFGFNLLYHALTTKDQAMDALLEQLFSVSASQLPNRELVPLSIETEAHSIKIRSPQDDVNTALAYLDIMQSDQITMKQNLIYVDQGETILSLRYPHLDKGLPVSLLGLVLALLCGWWIKRRRREEVI